jgi:hypothetical protein
MLLVLMQNDFPIGIYSSFDEAMKASDVHYNKNYKHHGGREKKFYHYRAVEFVVDAEAR